jgi:phytoene desaturase
MADPIIVIGAGVGGLACAARLAAAGHRVTVLEQADRVGGKLGAYERHTGAGAFRFDTGPSLLTLPDVFAELFAATGSTLEQEVELVPLDPLVRHVFADGTVLDSSPDEGVFIERITQVLGPAAARDWARFWRRAERIWTTSLRHVLRSPVDSPFSLGQLAWRLSDLAAIGPGRTLRGLGGAYLGDDRLRILLDRYATYTGSDPRRAPAALAAIPYAELRFGGWYLRGGLATLAEALRRRCLALGVDVVLKARVVRIRTARRVAGRVGGRRVAGVDLADGTSRAATIVVANADAASVYRHLLPTPRRAARLVRRSLSGFVLLLGVRGRTPGQAHHTVYFGPRYDDEFDAIFGRPARPVADPTVFVTVADDPSVSPAGHESWFVLVNAPPHGPSPSGVDWRASGLAEWYADHVINTLAVRGVDLRDRLLFRELRTPADLESATLTPGGAIYGTPCHGMGGLLRPANRSPIRGLYLVGGSSHPGGGLPMVALSAEIVAAMITNRSGP